MYSSYSISQHEHLLLKGNWVKQRIIGEMEEPTKISILGQENIVVHYNIWGSYIIKDLLHNVRTSFNDLTPQSFADSENYPGRFLYLRLDHRYQPLRQICTGV